MKTTYTAMIDGQTFTRTTERTYTHCVVARVVNDWTMRGIVAVEGETLGILGFCGSLALAQKLAAKQASFRFTTAADEAKHRPRAGKRFPTGTGPVRYADVQVLPVAPVVKGA